MKKFIFLCIFSILLILPSTEAFAVNSSEYNIYINRVDKTLYVLKPDGTILWKKPCGIGRGGITQKKNMADYVTPVGSFSVDIILYKDAKFDAVSEKIIDKYKRVKIFYGQDQS